MYNKLSKAELVKLAEDRDKVILEQEDRLTEATKALDGFIKKMNEDHLNLLAAKDLLDLATNTKSLEGLNETQVNAELIKRLRLIKHTIGKL